MRGLPTRLRDAVQVSSGGVGGALDFEGVSFAAFESVEVLGDDGPQFRLGRFCEWGGALGGNDWLGAWFGVKVDATDEKQGKVSQGDGAKNGLHSAHVVPLLAQPSTEPISECRGFWGGLGKRRCAWKP